MKRYKLKDKTGAISAFVMISMTFFLVVIVGAYAITSRRAQTQTQSVDTIQNYYDDNGEEEYNKRIAGSSDKIPIYTKEQLWSIGEDVSFEIDGIVYDFSSTTASDYELKNNIIINISELGNGSFKDNYVISNANGYKIMYYYNGNYYKLLNYSGTDYATGTASLSASGANFATVSDTTTGLTGSYYIFAENQRYNSEHPELHIPTGFHYLLGTVENGYVITDDNTNNDIDDGNEFVWIPVASPDAYSKKLGKNNWWLKSTENNGTYTQVSVSTVEDGIQGDVLGTSSILGETVTSTLADQPEGSLVNNAGGFWVGRYETGVESTNNATTFDWSNQVMVVKQGVQPVRYIYQNVALSRANSWKSDVANSAAGTVAFQSGLITGTQWDVMCEFIGWDTANSNCSTWGNYGNVKSALFTGWHSPDASNDWTEETSEVQKGDTYDYENSVYTNRWVFPTGKFVVNGGRNTAQKNIYDVAGNVWEWTTEVPYHKNGANSVLRGGSTNYSGTNILATFRHGYLSSTTFRFWGVGLRFVLYVE